MAKKKRRVAAKPEEEYEFVPPEFDEREFILKDIYATKVLLVVTLLAVVIGAAGAVIYNMKPGELLYGLIGIALMFLVIIGMKEFLKLLRFDPELLETKTMLGNYIMFLFLALGVWILIINL
jgi:hypothetical protein